MTSAERAEERGWLVVSVAAFRFLCRWISPETTRLPAPAGPGAVAAPGLSLTRSGRGRRCGAARSAPRAPGRAAHRPREQLRERREAILHRSDDRVGRRHVGVLQHVEQLRELAVRAGEVLAATSATSEGPAAAASSAAALRLKSAAASAAGPVVLRSSSCPRRARSRSSRARSRPSPRRAASRARAAAAGPRPASSRAGPSAASAPGCGCGRHGEPDGCSGRAARTVRAARAACSGRWRRSGTRTRAPRAVRSAGPREAVQPGLRGERLRDRIQ